MPGIHPTAVIEPGALIPDTAFIGPFCHIGSHVELGENVVLISHVVIAGRTAIGANTRIFPFASIGHEPQDLKYAGEESQLLIGSGNTIREYVTMNPGTLGGGMVTRVGDHCLFMAGSHVAHDCQVGSRVIMANNATLAGHVTLGDHAFLGGLSAVHQFVRIGEHAMIGGMTGVERDVIPFGSAMGDRARLVGINLIGMQRRGFGREEIQAVRTAYQQLFSEGGTLNERVQEVAERFAESPAVMQIVNFIRADSNRALCQPKSAE
jgi:UDP-N-acetylglucosamine acyltransferase